MKAKTEKEIRDELEVLQQMVDVYDTLVESTLGRLTIKTLRWVLGKE